MKAWVLCLFVLLTGCGGKPAPPAADLSELLGGSAVSGFKRADVERVFEFPADHGKHPGFRNEWWYLTGNLFDPQGRRFGYQLTFFRIGMGKQDQPRQSEWAADHVWMAHFAISDVDNKEHVQSQRFAREAVALAGVTMDPFTVWLEDWSVAAVAENTFPWKLNASTDEFALSLELNSEKMPVLQGENGLSRKGAEPGNASYYYSMTRISSEGELIIGGRPYQVAGLSWLDREWSTSVLSEEQVGWDWFSLQFNDNRDLMYYQIRHKNGNADIHSAGSLIDKLGRSQRLRKQDVALKVMRRWTSASGHDYPVEWQMKIASEPATWIIRAVFEQQEMQTAVNYWEGAVDIIDAQSGETLGTGFLEMTGYR